MHTVHVCCPLSNVSETSVSQALSTKRTLVSGGQANVSFLHAEVGTVVLGRAVDLIYRIFVCLTQGFTKPRMALNSVSPVPVS